MRNTDTSNYGHETHRENNSLDFSIVVFGETVVKLFSTHVRIQKDDWEKHKDQIIKILKGESTDATYTRKTEKIRPSRTGRKRKQ